MNKCETHNKQYTYSPFLEDANEICGCCGLSIKPTKGGCVCVVYYSPPYTTELTA